MADPLLIGGQMVPPRSRTLVELPLPPLYTHTPLVLPVHVVRGAKSGPHLFVSAAIHGDEINGVEIIRRLLKLPILKRIRGTLFAVPIINVYGLLHHSRYLPDRRDLNRSFPGSDSGSLAARLAHLFMTEIVANSTHGIDLHTGSMNRTNLPQIRANLADEETTRLAKAFGVPVIINANLRDGSLREAVAEHGIPMLVYEAGEALRFHELPIRAGLKGVVGVMRSLGMLPQSRSRRTESPEPFVARSSTWVRAPASGLFRSVCALGRRVRRGDVLGLIDDPFGGQELEVTAVTSGIIIGRSEIPLIYEGDALFHIARFEDVREVASQVESFQNEHSPIDDAGSEPPIV